MNNILFYKIYMTLLYNSMDCGKNQEPNNKNLCCKCNKKYNKHEMGIINNPDDLIDKRNELLIRVCETDLHIDWLRLCIVTTTLGRLGIYY